MAAAMIDAMREAAQAAGTETSALLGVGAGSPGVVDEESGTVASARWVGNCWPRTSRPLAMSAASASTMRRKTGPCRSDSVGSQSMQFFNL